MADPVMRAAGIPIIQSFNESVPMWAAHRDNGQGHECTHYCFPSAPEVGAGRKPGACPQLSLAVLACMRLRVDPAMPHVALVFSLTCDLQVWVAELYRTLQQLQPAANRGV